MHYLKGRGTLVTLLVLLLSSCGGGGGESTGGGVPPTPTPPPPPPNASAPLQLTDNNAAAAATMGMKLPENVLQLYLYVQTLVKDAVDANELVRQYDCIFGDATTTISDNDSSGAMSSGDTVGFQFNSCVQSIEAGALSGALMMTVSEFTGSGAEPIVLNGRISIAESVTLAIDNQTDNEMRTDQLEGAFDFVSSAYEFSDSLALSLAPGMTFVARSNGLEDSITNLFLSRDGSTGGYRFGFESDIESESIGGAFRCLTGTFFLDDQQGVLECTGAGNSALQLVMRDSGPFLDLGVDDTGDENYSPVAVNAGTGFDPTLGHYGQTPCILN
jgi:hypothetical protein